MPPTQRDPSQTPRHADARTWTTRRLLDWIQSALKKRHIDSPRLLAEMLVTHTLACSRLDLYTDPDRPASQDHLQQLRHATRRALNNEPVQYIVGEAWFLGLRLQVDQRVLIPRPATETLVEELLQDARARNLAAPRGRERAELINRAIERDLSRNTQPDDLTDDHTTPADHPPDQPMPNDPQVLIADVGTGSGAIALAILAALPNARALASDISPDALEVAAANAEAHDMTDRIRFLTGNLTEPIQQFLTQQANPSQPASLDYLAANPPYIPDHEWNDPTLVAGNVKGHEPEIALRGGTDGLDAVRPILQHAPDLLKPGGMALVEVASRTAHTAADIARQAGLNDIRILKDLEGHPRIIAARA